MALPARPAPRWFQSGVKTIDAAIINGADDTNIAARLPPKMPRYHGDLTADQSLIDCLNGHQYNLCWYRAAKPIFTTLRNAGANLVHQLAFADHHPYSE